ncbi:hypothetical protein HY468_03870 [Candidatus Roizmanbacteria bacterium]|nr:hypothetical protein [Candidatus Roizmanbacteria bacterium]
MDEEISRPVYPTEASIIRKYLPAFTELTDGISPEIKRIIGQNTEGIPSRAWRVVLRPPTPDQTTGIVCDWDDTLEPYTARKENLYTHLIDRLIPKTSELRSSAGEAFRSLNKAARVLPVSGIHPEHYAPLLELHGINGVLKTFNQQGISKDFLDTIIHDPRGYLQGVVPELKERVTVQSEGKKTYFKEKNHQATALIFNQRPQSIDEQLWILYKQSMTEVTIPANELSHFDVSSDTRFFVATFGELGFQMEKILNALRFVKLNRNRTPDEIILCSRGRKKPILQTLINEFPAMQFVYLDDSPRQTEDMQGMKRMVPVHAYREGASRSTEPVVHGVLSVDVARLPLSRIVKIALSGKEN